MDATNLQDKSQRIAAGSCQDHYGGLMSGARLWGCCRLQPFDAFSGTKDG